MAVEGVVSVVSVGLTIAASTIGYVVWLTRIESKVREHTIDISELKADSRDEIRELKAKMDDISNRLLELCITVANLSGYIKRHQEDD